VVLIVEQQDATCIACD